MAEYIDRQTAINAICRDWCNRDYCGDCFFYGARQAIDVLKALPDADVQPVVRCRDCKYWEETLNGKGYCKDIIGFGRWWKGNDYCSYGEREDG